MSREETDTMKTSRLTLTLSGALLFALGLTTGLTAQTLTDSPQRAEQKRADLSGTSNMEVIASIVELKPGQSSNLHVHHGVEAFHVLQGALVQAPGKEASMMPTGLTGLNLRDVQHGSFKVVGDMPLKLFTVHVVDKNAPLYDFVK
jgi:oxalate decarboxylase/phosphoglucose isomerase-like protein (cupin superfamily)